jgi:hypothetical protein
MMKTKTIDQRYVFGWKILRAKPKPPKANPIAEKEALAQMRDMMNKCKQP